MKRVQFNPSIVVENGGTRLTSNAGAFLLRDVDDRLGMTRDLSRRLVDDRHPGTVFSMAELTRTLLYLPAQGFSDLDDGDLLRHDPAFRLAVSDKKGTRPLDDNGHGLPSQPTLSRALHRLGSDDNRAVLASVLRERAIAVRAKKARQRFCVVDVDSLPVEVHGHQKGSAYNGHYRIQMFHPLLATLGDDGDFVGVKLRPGNVHTADGVAEFLAPILDDINQADIADDVLLRVDAGFPCQDFFDLADHHRAKFVARIKNNSRLDEMAQPFLKRPVGRPPAEPRTFTHELTYKAGTWNKELRVVLAVQEPPEGELFFHHFWLVTNVGDKELDAAALVALYRQRGTAESRFGDFMSTLQPHLSSTVRINIEKPGARQPKQFTMVKDPEAANEARLLLFALTANLMRALKRVVAPIDDATRGLRRLVDRVLRCAARVIVHARGIRFLVEGALGATWPTLVEAIEREPQLA
jgi:hypothetical protein